MVTVKLSSKIARSKLVKRHEPYWLEVDRGFSLGYRKSKSGGTWYARRYNAGRYIKRRLGLADDNQPADGKSILSYTQARKQASGYEDVLELFKVSKAPASFTVRTAVEEYLDWYKANRKSYKQAKTKCRVHIYPKLGDVPISLLTAPQINKWLQEMAISPPLSSKGNPRPPYATRVITGDKNRVGNPVYRYQEIGFEQWTDEMKRQRKSTANRVLTVLKAALNFAWRNGHVDDPGAWQKVRAFKGADAPRVKYLKEDQARQLLSAASDDFHPMLKAALLTGCRYGELCRLRVVDYADGQIFIAKEKSDKPRHIPLSYEGITFFNTLARNKKPGARLITHKDGSRWKASHQVRPMRGACEKIGIEPVGFHVLRHTYATLLLRPANGSQGVSIRYVAALLGDSVATCEKHYGHVIQEDLRMEVIRKMPEFESE